MANIKKYDINGKEIGQLSIDDKILADKANMQLIKDYLVILNNNQRQWSANTKGRSEINCTKTKPHPQKGTGRARQGFLGAPQYKGGGIVFGPKPKFNQNKKMNQKQRRGAVLQLLSEKIREGKAIVVEAEGLDSPKTKKIANFLNHAELQAKKVLFLGKNFEEQDKKTHLLSFAKSTRNIPKTSFKYIDYINGYDLALNQHLVIMSPAFEDMIQLLKKGVKNESQ